MKKINPYLKEFKWQNFLRVFAIITTIYLCRKYFFYGVNKFIIVPFQIDQINSSIDLDILAFLIFTGCIIRVLYLILFRDQKPCINSCINIFLVITCYCLVVRFSGAFILEPIGYAVKYLDVLFFAVISVITKFKYYSSNKPFNSKNGFIEDDFQPERNNDILGRRKYACQIGIKILDTQPLRKAFVIAINSPWGFGKSGFLLLLEEFFQKKQLSEFSEKINSIYPTRPYNLINELYSNHQNTIIVKYNPWKNFDDKKTIQDFFDELSSSINQYDSNLSKKIKDYGNYFNKLDDSVFTKFIELTVDSVQSEQTLTGLFQEINNSILRIQKKIIVFVDDLDRLTGDELIDILKLIRNTANFKNTFFIVAYDHNYVLNSIDKKRLISNKEEYLQKIVQLEITLPIFKKNILLQFLDEEIKGYGISELEFQDIKNAINEISGIIVFKKPKEETSQTKQFDINEFIFRSEEPDNSLIFRVFQNIRDVVRFVNSFKLSFESIGNLGDVYEIIMLEFLKIKYLSAYQMVATKKFLHIVKKQYEFDFEEFDEFMNINIASIYNILPTNIEVIRTILEKIFSSTRKTYFRSIKHPQYFDIYFTYQAPNLTALQKIEDALKIGIDRVISVIDESVKDGSFEDLRNFLDSQTEFSSKNDFEIILKTLFYIAKYDNRT